MFKRKQKVKICIICGEEFLVSARKSKGRKSSKLRHKNARTCSKECSREYNKIRRRKSNITNNIKEDKLK